MYACWSLESSFPKETFAPSVVRSEGLGVGSCVIASRCSSHITKNDKIQI